LGALVALNAARAPIQGASAEDLEALYNLVPWTPVLIKAERVYAFVVGIGFGIMGGAIFSKAPWAAYFGVLTLGVALIVGTIDVAANLLWLSNLDDALAILGSEVPVDMVVESVGSLGSQTLAPAIWLAYLFRSKRVRNTFGEVTWTGFRQWLPSQSGVA
jgi:hypothetical protein